MSSSVAACSSVSSHLPNKLRTARNMAAASSWVIGSGRKAVTAVSTGCRASMAFLHMAVYKPNNAIWQIAMQGMSVWQLRSLRYRSAQRAGSCSG